MSSVISAFFDLKYIVLLYFNISEIFLALSYFLVIIAFTGATVTGAQTSPSTASVCFHPHCGSLIKLSNNNRTAERQRPTEEFKNAVTLTNIPLRNDELFEVR